MREREIREILRRVCSELDARAALGSAVLGATLTLGCGGAASNTPPPDNQPDPYGPSNGTSNVIATDPDPGGQPEYMAPGPGDPDPGPQVEYMAPEPGPGGAVPPYMAPDPGPDPGGQPEYMAPDPGPAPPYMAPWSFS